MRLNNWDRTDANLSRDWNLSKVGDWNSLTTNGATQNRTHGPAHELTAIATQPLTYDSRGNLASDNQSRSFVWDADNHLKSVNVSTGAPVGQVGTHSYEYDALGRRVSKTSGGTTTVFVNLTQPIPPLGTTGGQIIAEYTAGTAATNPLRETIYGSYIDEPLAIIDGPTGTAHYYHQNARYDVVGLSDTAGSIVERYAYDAYGDTIILDGTGTTQRTTSQYANRFAFTGRELDDESGLYDFRARYYDGRFGRFVGRDPIAYADGWNLYVGYFAPDWIDPLGLQTIIDAVVPGYRTNPPIPYYPPNPPRKPPQNGGGEDCTFECASGSGAVVGCFASIAVGYYTCLAPEVTFSKVACVLSIATALATCLSAPVAVEGCIDCLADQECPDLERIEELEKEAQENERTAGPT